MTAHYLRGTLVPARELPRCKSTVEDTARLTTSTGPSCKRCFGSEADCARRAGCCPDCTHWQNYTADGEEIDRPVGRPRRPRRRAS